MHLPKGLIESLAESEEFRDRVAEKLNDAGTYADSEIDIVDGILSDTIRVVLESL